MKSANIYFPSFQQPAGIFILPGSSLALSPKASTGLVWGGERKCRGYEPQGGHKESYSICLRSSHWFSSSALTSPKDEALNNRKSVGEVRWVEVTFTRAALHEWVMWPITKGWVLPPQTGFFGVRRMCWPCMESFTLVKSNIFSFYLPLGVLSCKSSMRVERAVEANTCSLMRWNTSNIFPFSQWVVGFFFLFWANNRK